MDKPLSGVKVLDLSRVVAGPLATQTLSDLGADVVKVESPLGDETRRFGPPFHGGWSTYFLSINRGKRSLCLDFKDADDLALLEDLLRHADICVQNFRPGVAEKFNLDGAALHSRFPRLIVAVISGFGVEGFAEFSSRPGYDLILQGMGGLASLCGPVEGVPFKSPASIVDILTAQNAVTGILAARLTQVEQGRGTLLDLSMLESRIWSQMYHASGYLNGGHEPKRAGNQHASIVPYQLFECRDGYLNIACGNDEQFERLCQVLGLEHLVEDVRFSTNQERVIHREPLLEILVPTLMKRDARTLEADLLRQRVPAGRVLSIGESLDLEQNESREFLMSLKNSADVELRFVRTPHGYPCPPSDRLPPELGADKTSIIEDWLATPSSASRNSG